MRRGPGPLDGGRAWLSFSGSVIMAEIFGFDCYSPAEIAERVEQVGVTKARLPFLSQAALGLLAGGFIGLGAMFHTLVMSDPAIPWVLARLLGGGAFSLGLILVVVAGAELFTGNNLVVMTVVAGRIPFSRFLRILGVAYLANFAGAAGLAGLVSLSGGWHLAGDAVGRTALGIASAKCLLPMGEAFFKGVLCNVLVCLAVWIAMAGRSVTDKVLAVILPVTAFVACGYEHSVANMYFIPLGLLLRDAGVQGSATISEGLTWAGFLRNLVDRKSVV
mgnify:FL=1